MFFFVLTFLCLFGGINFYAFFRARSIFHFSGFPQIIIIIVLILLICAPILVRVAESYHQEFPARAIAYIGYIWMAFVFLFFFFNVTFEIIVSLYKLIGSGTGSLPLRNFAFGAAIFLALIFVVYGFFDAQIVRVKKLEVHTGQLLPNDGKIRIVQISDVHVGLIIRNRRLQVILDQVKEAKPDILVSTGDLLDGELDNVIPQAQHFVSITPKYGKYAILGNHEYYAGLKRSMEFTKTAGFDLLRDDIRQIAGLSIFGADDITGRRLGVSKDNLLFEKMLAQQGNGFVLLLKHQPFVTDGENFNLQLSGHTHGGQIFPFMLITRLFFPRNQGYYQLGVNKSVYITSGAGTWGPPVRIFAPPEITIIDLIGK
ncbi:MAG: metallophosphoesterase [Deltaproteobacteria bacterium]|nr:metallophosphoesterase [Deltaproteobacteria bacterium]